jgi:sphingolipid 4-desaturase/C4-monooxygenase
VVDKVITETAAPAVSRARTSSDDARNHNEIRRRVLEAHPEAAELIGPDWRTALFAGGLLALHWSIAWGVSKTTWWVVLFVALFFGQFVYHAASSLVHESAHRLVFRGARAKVAFDLLLEAILTSFGYLLVYQHNHVTSHHAHLGDYEGDYEHEDIYRVAARRMYRELHPWRWRVINIGLMALHLVPFAVITDTLILPRVLAHAMGLPVRDGLRNTQATRPPRGEVRLFMVFSVAVLVAVYFAFGVLGLLYQIWCISLIGSRWGASIRGQILSEHYGEDAQHPTRSTYWWGNRAFFNIGYHVEHHTFPNVAWTRLPRLKAIAPETFNVANELDYFGFWWKQVKSDFTLPRRRSAVDPGPIMRKRVVEEAAATVDTPPIAAVPA